VVTTGAGTLVTVTSTLVWAYCESPIPQHSILMVLVPAAVHGPTVNVPESERRVPSMLQYTAFSPAQVRVAVPVVRARRDPPHPFSSWV